MIINLSIDEAKDLIDTHGPDEVFWPLAEKPILKQLISNDPSFREYVEDAKWLEDMLANWEMIENGAEIDLDLDDDAFTPPPIGEDDSDDVDADDQANDDIGDDEDQDTDPGDDPDAAIGNSGGLSSRSEDDEFGKGSDNNSVGHGLPPQSDGSEDEGEDEEEEPQPIVVVELDPEDIKDMDGMLTEFIRDQTSQLGEGEFRVFSRDYDELVDIKIPDHVSLEEIDKAVAQSTGPLQKDLRRMIAARSQARRHPGKRSGRLHAPNLHRILSGDDRVFFRKEEAPVLDTAITLLLDCSGSMEGERMKLATETAYAIATVLNRLNVPFECIGFTDRYNHPIMKDKEFQRELVEADSIAKIIRAVPLAMPRFKTFDERWTHPIQRRFGHVFNRRGSHDCGIPWGSTPEGCGIEFAARRLLARGEKRKIMMVMTDGEPCGHIYNPRYPEDGDAYQRHSEEMVKRVEASGVDLIGIGIQHSGPTDYYSNSMVINAVDEMPKKLMDLLKKFIVG